MTRNRRYTVEQVIRAIEGSGGIKAVVAKKLGCSRQTVSRYAARYVTVQQALDDADQAITDAAEIKAISLIDAGYWPAIKYRLETKGKSRGYTTRTEITGADGGPAVLVLAGNVSADDI